MLSFKLLVNALYYLVSLYIFFSIIVVIRATLGPDQSERSKFCLDQSESRIWPMWLMWRHNAHIWYDFSRDPME